MKYSSLAEETMTSGSCFDKTKVIEKSFLPNYALDFVMIT